MYPEPVPGAVAVYTCDLEYLEPEEFLNDTIIDFALRWYSKEKSWGDHQQNFHVFSSFFYTRLSQESTKDCSAVGKWAKDIFKKDFLLIPINQHLHWTLAIVCYAGQVAQKSTRKPGDGAVDMFDHEASDDEEDMCSPCILYLDSLGGAGTRLMRHIYKYLNYMLALETKHDMSTPYPLVFKPKTLPCKKAKVPEQENSYDCGLFVLEYAKRLMKLDFAKTVRELVAEGKPNWFSPSKPGESRQELRDEILKKSVEQNSKQQGIQA